MSIEAVPQLRPLSMGQLLDRAIRIYRQNFWTFTGIVALTQIPTTIFSILVTVAIANYTPSSRSPDTGNEFLDAFLFGLNQVPPWAATVNIIILFVGFLLTMLAYAGVVQSVAEVYLGKEVELVDALTKAGKRWSSLFWPLIAAAVLTIFLVIYWIFVPFLGWFTGAGLLFFWVAAAAYLVTPIVILERKGAFGTLARTWELSRRRFWWLLGFGLILIFFNWLIIQGPSLLIASALVQFGGFGLASTESQIVQQVVNTLLSAIYLPLQLTCYTLIYFDLRIRTEGLDLSLQAATSEAEGLNITHLLAKAPPASGKVTPTGEEWLWFFLITIGLYALIIIFYAILFAIIFLSFSASF